MAERADTRQLSPFLLLPAKYSIFLLLLEEFFSPSFSSFLLSSLDYIWCNATGHTQAWHFKDTPTTFCTRPEFKSTAEFFFSLKKLHQQILYYHEKPLFSRSCLPNAYILLQSSCFFFFCYFCFHTTLLYVLTLRRLASILAAFSVLLGCKINEVSDLRRLRQQLWASLSRLLKW